MKPTVVPIKWKKEYSVGVELIDEEHLAIIELINDLIRDEAAHNHPEGVEKALFRMMNYAQTHFKAEEKLLERYGYPGLADQKKAHEDFAEEARSILYRLISHEFFDSSELLNYLHSWWVNHILIEDMAYKPFLKKHGVS